MLIIPIHAMNSHDFPCWLGSISGFICNDIMEAIKVSVLRNLLQR